MRVKGKTLFKGSFFRTVTSYEWWNEAEEEKYFLPTVINHNEN